jgi:hypothetical protein
MRPRANSWPFVEAKSDVNFETTVDAKGRVHVACPRMGPANLFLRSNKYNPVSIATHVVDWVKTFTAYMGLQQGSPHPTVAVSTTGDGCQDLTSSRIVNMLLWWLAIRPLMVTYNLVYAIFGQFWPDDSPSNDIERKWAWISKELCNLTLLDHLPEDGKCPNKMSGLSDEQVWEKDKQIFAKCFETLLDRLEGKELVKGIKDVYNTVPLGSESDLHVLYKNVMSFHHSGHKTITADAKLQELRRQYRVLAAHWDRRSITSHIVLVVPHLLRPEEFGTVEDCEMCSQITVGSAGKRIIDEIVRNDGPYSPSRAQAEPGESFNTYLQVV